MAYTINKTDGSIFATVPDGTVDNTTSSLTLIGKNYEGYGDALNENYVRLLESHANITEPTAPHKGQLWFDSSPGVNTLNVYNGTEFKPIGTSVIETTEPPAPEVGDQWYNSTTNQLNVYNGTEYVIVGPLYSTAEGTSGAIVETITSGTGAVDHVVTKLYIGTDVVGIISKDTTFTPDVAIPGFTTVSPGLQMSTITPGIIGDASNALALGGEPAASYLRSDVADTTSETLGILNDGGLTVGAGGDLTLTVTGTGQCEIRNTTQDREIAFYVNNGSVDTKVLWMGGTTTEHPQVNSPSDPLDIANRDYVDNLTATYLPLAGGTLTNDLTMGFNQIIFNPADDGEMVLNGNAGTASSGSHIAMGDNSGSGHGVISAGNGLYLISDNTGTSGGHKNIVFGTGTPGYLGMTTLMNITPAGSIETGIGAGAYEAIVVADGTGEVLTNKQYVDNKIHGSMIGVDNPVESGVTLYTNTTSAWQSRFVATGAKFAMVSIWGAGIFNANSGNSRINVYCRRPGVTGAASSIWRAWYCGADDGATTANNIGASMYIVECNAAGNFEYYGYKQGSTSAPFAYVKVIGYWI